MSYERSASEDKYITYRIMVCIRSGNMGTAKRLIDQVVYWWRLTETERDLIGKVMVDVSPEKLAVMKSAMFIYDQRSSLTCKSGMNLLAGDMDDSVKSKVLLSNPNNWYIWDQYVNKSKGVRCNTKDLIGMLSGSSVSGSVKWEDMDVTDEIVGSVMKSAGCRMHVERIANANIIMSVKAGITIIIVDHGDDVLEIAVIVGYSKDDVMISRQHLVMKNIYERGKDMITGGRLRYDTPVIIMYGKPVAVKELGVMISIMEGGVKNE